MNIKRPIRFLGFSYASAAVSFSAQLLMSILLLSSGILLLSLQSAFADSYSDGYNEGCYNAGRDFKGLNGHGYDESVHHGDTQFRIGYVNGYRTCYSNSEAGEERGGGNYLQPRQPQPQLPKLQPPSQQLPGFLRVGPYWWKVCNDYDSLISEPCNTLVTPDGYALTIGGVRVLACVVGGAIALVYPELLYYSFLCGQTSSGGGGNQQ
jgi:hypothetical protein